jgi:hypothetical protein
MLRDVLARNYDRLDEIPAAMKSENGKETS